jgi:hypothetical protein
MATCLRALDNEHIRAGGAVCGVERLLEGPDLDPHLYTWGSLPQRIGPLIQLCLPVTGRE